MKTPLVSGIGILLLTLAAAPMHAESPSLTAEKPVVVTGSGGFDFLQVDAAKRRLLASHTGNGTLDVIDLDSGKLLKQVPTGKAQDVAVDGAAEQYLVSVSKEHVLVVIDAKSLAKTGEVDLGGEADVLTFNPKNHYAYVVHDHAPELWVVDPSAKKIVTTIRLPGEPEDLCYDAASNQVYQNIVTPNSVAVIDPAENLVQATWTTGSAARPHGLAIDPDTHVLFSAGANGKLAVLNLKTGQMMDTIDIAEGVDQIAYDAGNKRLYCASRKGMISVIGWTDKGAVSLGQVQTATGAKTIAVDPSTHAVWVAYADKEHSYVLRLHLNS
jgi:DNA-binding beta-propeller fold protein YncE